MDQQDTNYFHTLLQNIVIPGTELEQSMACLHQAQSLDFGDIEQH